MTQPSKLPWHSEFVEMGGYDCMTDAQRIYSGAQLVATVDYSDFGQNWCQPFSDDTKAKADANAALIVEAVNSHAALVGRVAKLEGALREAGTGHFSDCAVNNEPAYPVGKCDCGARISRVAELEAENKAADELIKRLTESLRELTTEVQRYHGIGSVPKYFDQSIRNAGAALAGQP